MPNKIKVDKAIMQELLSHPDIAPKVAQMTSKELEFYKRLLVSQGVYSLFVLERGKEQIRQAWKGNK